MNQSSLFHIAVCLLYLGVFGEASTSKARERELPQWFVDQFSGTWLARFPLGLQYRGIMVLEFGVVALFVTALVRGEPWTGGPNPFMGYGLLLASGFFSALCFGQRVSSDFVGAASSFVYSALSLVLWFLVSMGGA